MDSFHVIILFIYLFRFMYRPIHIKYNYGVLQNYGFNSFSLCFI